jgi:hypothetical protein
MTSFPRIERLPPHVLATMGEPTTAASRCGWDSVRVHVEDSRRQGHRQTAVIHLDGIPGGQGRHAAAALGGLEFQQTIQSTLFLEGGRDLQFLERDADFRARLFEASV